MKPPSSRPAKVRKHPSPRVFSPLPPAEPGAGQPGIGARAPHPDTELRRSMIAEAAYFRAEQRGFEPGRDLEDAVGGMQIRGHAFVVLGRAPARGTRGRTQATASLWKRL